MKINETLVCKIKTVLGASKAEREKMSAVGASNIK